jgi:hypothetical protein
LLHDVGAFQVGLGAALLFALIWRGDAILAALGGASAGAVAHSVAHVADDGMGGRSTDPYTLAVVAAVLVLTFVWRLYERQRTSG